MHENIQVKFAAIEQAMSQVPATALTADRIDTSDLSNKALEQARATMQQMAESLAVSGPNAPKEVEVSLGLTVTAGGDIWVANLEAEGTIQVTMTWKQ